MSESEIECTYATCSVKEDGQIEYIPTLEGNIGYGGIFLFILMLQVFFGVKYKTWGFMAGMTCGLLLEIVGYAGRVLLHDNVFEKNYFIIYLVGLTIAPAFLSASLYLCLGRIITLFGDRLSLLRPKIITWIFVCCDLLSLLLQSVGGAITSISDDQEGSQRGIDIMMAGLWSQVISLSIFIILCSHFAFNVLMNPSKVNPDTVALRQTIKFKCFLLAIGIATLTIMIRSTFRLAELQEGFSGHLANDEVLFMILEGPMIIVAVAVLTIWHPGLVCGANTWKNTSFRNARKRGKSLAYKEMIYDDDNIAMVPVARH
ncbi:uncharacterized protein A1O9_03889 [Exophiala aquamarina CBS 119918]|uniref:RTA1 domain protein n=1 Tax=Exophiala aquamarina CBS 119918 TaxID=1182545 RepID=A0A072PGQ2_9EURO|nr:uncharacterized protein A1O9_03889 [Exophiala aquamarina CBS 119918]KEF59046.1 hypothetical protein A1O9_03889 [Exophiala aquamarina CBS 119918]